MEIVRETETYCPLCGNKLSGYIIIKENGAYLHRNCKEHGAYDLLLSRNGKLYAELDSFYFSLNGIHTNGRITNYWIFATSICNLNCTYCALDLNFTKFDDMKTPDFMEVIKRFGKTKLTLSGGEPTLNPDIFSFFKMARKANVTTQLATNGIKLSDMEFCNRLKEAGLREVRISTESFDIEGYKNLKNEIFLGNKLKAINNLEKLKIKTILSPTIFYNINEGHLIECLEMAKDRLFICEISVNGFSWTGNGVSNLKMGNMIMPDPIVDILFEKYFKNTCSREDLFTFFKLILITLKLLKIRLCLNTQILIFYRHNSSLIPITSFLNMKKMKKYISIWEKKMQSNILVKIIYFLLILFGSFTTKSFKLIPSMISMFVSNLFHAKIYKYPSKLLPVVINTTCSLLSADSTNSIQCMSGTIGKQDNIIIDRVTTDLLKTQEIRRTSN